jgi:hypothetical protein
MSMFLPVVAVPVTLPVTLPVTAPVRGPENADADNVSVDGLYKRVLSVDKAAPAAVAAVVNTTLCAKFDAPAATTFALLAVEA